MDTIDKSTIDFLNSDEPETISLGACMLMNCTETPYWNAILKAMNIFRKGQGVKTIESFLTKGIKYRSGLVEKVLVNFFKKYTIDVENNEFLIGTKDASLASSLINSNVDKEGKFIFKFIKSWNHDFVCYRIRNLYGCPEEIRGNFKIYNSILQNLEHSPFFVGGDMVVVNVGLRSLFGAPAKVGGDFRCSNNELTSLEFRPRSIGGKFIYGQNPVASYPESV